MQSETAQLLTEDILRCLNYSLLLEVKAKSGWIHLNQSLKQEGKRECRIRLTGPSGTIFRFQQPRTMMSDSNLEVEIKDSKPRPVRFNPWLVSKWGSTNPPFAFSLGHRVTLLILQHNTVTAFLPFNVSFLSFPHQPPLEVFNMSKTTGSLD